MDRQLPHYVRDQQMQCWQRAIARVRAGTGRARLLVLGDSTNCGAGAGLGGMCRLHGAYANGWPQLLARLAAPLVPFSANSLVGTQGVTEVAPELYDPRVAPGAGWAAASNTGTVGGGLWGFTGSTASAFAFTPTGAFDTLTIRYAQQPRFGSFTVTLDGGPPLGSVATSGVPAYKAVTYRVPPGAGTVNILPGADGRLFIGAIEASNSAVPAADVLQGAWFGARAQNFSNAGTPWAPLNAIPLFAPDLTVINLTINDSNKSTAPGEYQLQMQQIISAARQTGDVLLMVGAPSKTVQALDGTLDSFIAIINLLALTNGCPVLDLKQRWGGYAEAQAAFPYCDSLHPGALAYQDVARAIYEILSGEA
jgi:lysophospholipase L1-like esterase